MVQYGGREQIPVTCCNKTHSQARMCHCFKWRVLSQRSKAKKCGLSFWVWGSNTDVCPFKQKLPSSTFLWLRGLFDVLQNGFQELFLARIAVKKSIQCDTRGLAFWSEEHHNAASFVLKSTFPAWILALLQSSQSYPSLAHTQYYFFRRRGRWRYQESNFSLQMFLPCSSYSAFVTHILLRNTSVLDRATPPSHACVTGLKQR